MRKSKSMEMKSPFIMYNNSSYDESHQFDDENVYKENVNKTFFTFQDQTYLTFAMRAYVINKYILEKMESMVIKDAQYNYAPFAYDFNKKIDILIHGVFVFIYNNRLITCNVDANHYTFKFQIDSGDITDLKEYINTLVIEYNPYKAKLLYYINSELIEIKQTPKIDFKDVILDETIKQDIYDNTIYHLNNLDGGNGIILHGIPGVGKSLICSAISKNAVENGYSVIYLTSKVDFEILNLFISDCLKKCIVILEDIDSFTISREYQNSDISQFLQFLNGISENENKIICIATTNYLDKLDSAIANRPVRFNRKYKFEYPSDAEMNKLLGLYFDDNVVNKYAKNCYGLNFTGAHIREIQRTSNLLISKSNATLTYDDVFMESLQLVKNNFSMDLKDFGFNN